MTIKFKVLTKLLSEIPNLSDELVVSLAEYANQTHFQMQHLSVVTDNILAEISIFGDEGIEKELVFIPKEEEDRNVA